MKRFMTLVALVLALSCLTMPVMAESESESGFNQLMQSEGFLIVKEYIDFKKVDFYTFQIATVTDPIANVKYSALRCEAFEGESSGVIDVNEIDDFIVALEYIKTNLPNMKAYAEIKYRSTLGLGVAGYVIEDKEPIVNILFTSGKNWSLSFSNIDAFISALQAAQAELAK